MFSGKEYIDYNIEEVSIIKSNHLWAAIEEDKFINNFTEYKYTPIVKFGGHTECFKEEIYNIVFKEKYCEA